MTRNPCFIFIVFLLLLTGCIPAARLTTPSATSIPLEPTRLLAPTAAAEATATVESTAAPQLTIASTTVPEPIPVPRPTATPLPSLPPGEPLRLAWIQMLDPLTGWAIDTAGRILHTNQGPSVWVEVTPPAGSFWSWGERQAASRTPGGFFALDGLRAWAVATLPMCFTDQCPALPDTAIVWRTADGGQTWQPSTSFCPNWAGCELNGGHTGDPANQGFYPHTLYPVALQFIDPRTGWLMVVLDHYMFQERYGIYHTTDGGDTWTQLATNEDPGMSAYNLTGLGFSDAQTGWLAESEVGGATTPGQNWWLHRTTDGGRTWQTFDLPAPPKLPAYWEFEEPWCGSVSLRVSQPNQIDTVFTCGIATRAFYEETFYAYHSTDGGRTWSITPASRSTVFLSASHGWKLLAPPVPNLRPADAANSSGAALTGWNLQRTTDGGQTWTNLRPVVWEAAQFNFITPDSGWTLVRKGGAMLESGAYSPVELALLKTEDGGQTWKMVNPAAGP